MSNPEEFNNIVLAALLHDIGKFVQRAQESPKIQNHSHWGEEWFQRNLAEKLKDEQGIIRSAISSHHYGHPHIVYLSDLISAGERSALDDEDVGDPFTDRLISIFSQISISEQPKMTKYYQLSYLHKNNLEETFPINNQRCTNEDYRLLLSEFTKEINTLEAHSLNSEQIIDIIYFLLMKYTWCVPSAAYRHEPDVSLFDHLKTSAAIAGCLYNYQKENPDTQLNIETQAFCLIEGDISGIQNYIFNILTQRAKVARRLRARSLFVHLISEIASHKILHEFGLPLCNLITSAGGNFQILLPNLKDKNERITKLQKEFDEWTLNELNAELSINLGYVEKCGKDLTNFSKVIEELKSNLALKKQQPHKSSLLLGTSWNEEQFVRPQAIESEDKVCSSCKRYPQLAIEGNEDNLCRYCWDEAELGKLIPKKRWLALFNDTSQKFKLLNYSFDLWDEIDLKNGLSQNPYIILSLNDTEINKPVLGFKFITTYTPTGLTFDDIASSAKGDKLLGYLKIDIDNLGKLLRYGFKTPSISRYSTFSRMLETFFSGYLQEIMEKEFSDTYTVFSGGDDVFVIGPWNKIIDFSKAIRKKFYDFCATNPDLTFSAGICLFKPHQPVSFCARSVQQALDNSKDKSGKNAITLFDHTVSWDELDKIMDESNKLIGWLEDGVISRNFAYMLWQSGIKYRNFLKTGKTLYLEFAPELAESIKRNLSPTRQTEAFAWASSLLPTTEIKTQDNLPLLNTIMDLVLTITRR